MCKTGKRRRTGQHIVFKSPFPWVIPLKLSTGPIIAWSEKCPPSLGADRGCWVRSAVEKSMCVRDQSKRFLCDRCILKTAITQRDKGKMHFLSIWKKKGKKKKKHVHTAHDWMSKLFWKWCICRAAAGWFIIWHSFTATLPLVSSITYYQCLICHS